MLNSCARFFITFLIIHNLTSLQTASAQEASADGTFGVSASYEFYGRAPYPINSRGARIGYIVTDGQELQLSFIRSEQNVLLSQYRYQEYALTLNARLSPSLYWGGGLGLRSVDIESNVFLDSEDAATQTQDKVHVLDEYQMLTGNIVLGFEYAIIDNLLIGTEMIGFSTPLYWFKKSEHFPDNALETEENPKTFPYIRDGLRSNVHLLRTFLKVRF